jgi:hypothetical protein
MEFLETNTAGKQLHDVVYVTANPHVYHLEPATFHAVVDTLDRWDPTLQTVPPGIVTNAALEAAAQYPHKRMLIHYMQPHYPFLGPTGYKLDHRGHRPHADADVLREPNIWAILQWQKDPSITEEMVRQAYIENLELVLEHVHTLLDEFEGRTVVSADHGNLIGDRLWPIPVRGYGHPPGLRAPALIEVPWLIHDEGPRRVVRPDRPVDPPDHSADRLDSKLRALGYR